MTAKLLDRSQSQQFNWLAAVVLASSVLVMPLLGRAKLRLGVQLDSGATAGEGAQDLKCDYDGEGC